MIFTTVFITKDLPHKDFIRSGQDLISTYDVTFKEMMCGVQYVINTLDYKQLRVNITQIITYVVFKLLETNTQALNYMFTLHSTGI